MYGITPSYYVIDICILHRLYFKQHGFLKEEVIGYTHANSHHAMPFAEISCFKFDDYRVIRTGASDLKRFGRCISPLCIWYRMADMVGWLVGVRVPKMTTSSTLDRQWKVFTIQFEWMIWLRKNYWTQTLTICQSLVNGGCESYLKFSQWYIWHCTKPVNTASWNILFHLKKTCSTMRLRNFK